MTDLEQLLVVQELDTRLDQLARRRATMPERQQLAEAEGAVAKLAGAIAVLAETRQELVGRQTDLDAQVSALSERTAVLEQRMLAARGSAPRDLQAMDDEIRHLSARRAELEEVELSVMEEQEPVDAELARLTDERSQLEEAAGALRRAMVAADAVVATEVATVERTRGAEMAKVPPALADRYETLRARLAGVAVARLVGNHCDGCHLELPSVEVERIHHEPPTVIVTCDQCGRMLVH